MKKLIILSCCLLGLMPVAFGQDVLLEQDVNKDTIPQTHGPNLKHYSQFYIGYGFIAGETGGPGADIKYGASDQGMFGYRYKRRISNFYAIGYELNYNVLSFHLDDAKGKVFPTPTVYDKEKLVLHNLGLGLYNRFNFGRRGNHLGKYLDLGVYGDWSFDSKYIAKYEQDSVNALGGKQVKMVVKDLDYLNKIHYGVTARFGINRFMLFGSYRLSDIFKEDYQQTVTKLDGYAELPRMVFGLQIGLK